MIKSFSSKALERYWTKNDARGIRPEHLTKVTDRLAALNAAKSLSDLNVPGYGFHGLAGNMAGRYAVKINKNWRITFAWDDTGSDAIDVDYLDYH